MIINKKSQLSVEFMIALATIIFLFFLFLSLILNKNSEIRNLQEAVDLKKECIKLGNAITNVYTAGPGTEFVTKTPYFITIRNDSIIEVMSSGNITIDQRNRIAIVLSESGVSTQTFYDEAVNTPANPDFFKTCTDDWYNEYGYTDRYLTDCNPQIASHPDQVDWQLIPKNLSDLLANIDYYNTIYLEDAHMHPASVYNNPSSPYHGMRYVDIFKNWTSKGNVLIASEHFYCTGHISGNDAPENHWECLGEDFNIDPEMRKNGENTGNYTFFDRVLKLGYPYALGHDLLIINEVDPYTFDFNQVYYINEPSFINPSTYRGGEVEIGIFEPAAYNLDYIGKAGMIFFPYGAGFVHYIADFETSPSSQLAFSHNLLNLIQYAYIVYSKQGKKGSETCTFYGISDFTAVTGKIKISNINDKILVNMTT